MTVYQLIIKLQDMPEDAIVLVPMLDVLDSYTKLQYVDLLHIYAGEQYVELS